MGAITTVPHHRGFEPFIRVGEMTFGFKEEVADEVAPPPGPPQELIPLRNGMVVKIDKAMWDQACGRKAR